MPPISDDEFNRGKKYTGLRKEILSFLCENKRKAYTIVDLIEYLRPGISSSEINEVNLKMLVGLTTISVVQRHYFQSALDDLIEDDLVKVRLVDHEIYYKCK
jgi:hypothetical protein